MLTIDGQLREKIRVVRFPDVVAELGVSVGEGKQLGVIMSGVRQATEGVIIMTIPGGKCGGSEDGRVKCREDRVEQNRLAGHLEERYSMDSNVRGDGYGRARGNQRRYRRVKNVRACRAGAL